MTFGSSYPEFRKKRTREIEILLYRSIKVFYMRPPSSNGLLVHAKSKSIIDSVTSSEQNFSTGSLVARRYVRILPGNIGDNFDKFFY